MPFLISFLVLLPLVPWLASVPQSPDGAEMVATAVHGGVLHPSGIPLQAWINRLAVQLTSLEPAYVLSWISWLGSWGTLIFLDLILRHLKVGFIIRVLALIAYAYVPVVAFMSLIPEKYTWLTLTQMGFVYLLVISVNAEVSILRRVLLGIAFALALAQHSANVILLFPFLYHQFRSQSRLSRQSFLLTGLWLMVPAVLTALAYASLLGLRTESVWPDWGHLSGLSDVWNHVVRQDYGIWKLHHSPMTNGEKISALQLLGQNLLSWNLGFLLIPLGVFALVQSQRDRILIGYWGLMVLPALALLHLSDMPAFDPITALGYQERYPMLVLPLLFVLWGLGFQWAWNQVNLIGKKSGIVILALAVSVPVLWGAFSAWRIQTYADNNLPEIHREQARFELDNSFGVFWTSSDFIAFYGIPVSTGILYPVKNLLGMDWYREHTLPKLSPALARVLATPPAVESLSGMFRRVLLEGYRIVATEPTRVLDQADLMAMAEQTGVLWTFSPENSGLYSRRILANTIHLCSLFANARRGLPAEGHYFMREILTSFHHAFNGAADYLSELGNSDGSHGARAIAEALRPGVPPSVWRERCLGFMETMRP